MTTVLNPDHAYEAYGRTFALRIPGGRWSVTVQPHELGWAAVAYPLGHSGESFEIATGPDLEPVRSAALGWVSSATVFPMPLNRAVFAGVRRASQPLEVAA